MAADPSFPPRRVAVAVVVIDAGIQAPHETDKVQSCVKNTTVADFFLSTALNRAICSSHA